MKKFTNSCDFHRQLFVLSVALACAALWMAQQTRADSGAAIPPVAATAQTGRGTVKGEHSNVRSRPSLHSEVVTQLHKGDAVDVLERKTVTEPRSDGVVAHRVARNSEVLRQRKASDGWRGER